MITKSRIAAWVFAAMVCLHPLGAMAAHADLFANVKTQADLDALIASTDDAGLKQAMRDDSVAILAAAGQWPHVQAVMHTVEASPGKFEKVNMTPPGLKKAAGGDIAIFDTLTVVDPLYPKCRAARRPEGGPIRRGVLRASWPYHQPRIPEHHSDQVE